MRSKFAFSALSAAVAYSLLISLPVYPSVSNKMIRGKISLAVHKANELFAQRKYEEAAVLYREALKKNSQDVDSRAGLGMALAMQFKLDAAEAQFDQALELDEGNSSAHVGKATVLLNRLQSSDKSITDQKANLLAAAEDHALKAISADPSSEMAHITLGKVLLAQGKQTDAYAAFQKAKELDPDSSAALAALGEMDLEDGKNDVALAELQRAVALNSGNSTAHYALGKALLRAGRQSEAIRELNTSLYQHPNSAPVHMALGKAYGEQQNYEAALKEFEKATLIKPELKAAYGEMADLHIKLGAAAASNNNTVGALKEYKQAVLIDPMNPKPYLAMAQLREQRGDYELAIDELKSGLELMPDDSALQKRIGVNYLKMGRVEESIAHLEKALQKGNDADTVHQLSQALYLKSRTETQEAFVASADFQSAEATLQKAIKLSPNDLKLRLALAKLHSMAGRPVNLAKIGTPHSVPEKIAYAEALLAQNQFDKSSAQMQDVIGQIKSAKDAIAIAEIAMLNMDHTSAVAAFAKAAELGDEERANFGIAAINRLKKNADERLTLANDLAKRGQLQSAADTYRDAIAADPRLADAHLGLSRVGERLSAKSALGLDDAAKELQAFVDLSKTLPEPQRQKDFMRIKGLQTRAAKLRMRESGNHT